MRRDETGRNSNDRLIVQGTAVFGPRIMAATNRQRVSRSDRFAHRRGSRDRGAGASSVPYLFERSGPLTFNYTDARVCGMLAANRTLKAYLAL
jgi:hypothetical protein